MKEIFELAEMIYLNDMKFKMTYNGESSPEVRIEADQFYEVANTPDETMAISRFDKIIFETKNVQTMFELLSYNIRRDNKEQNKHTQDEV